MKRALIWSFIMITIIASIERSHPGLAGLVGAGGGLGVHRPPLTHSTIALAVNQRTRDPGPVLAERELSLLAEGVGSRP